MKTLKPTETMLIGNWKNESGSVIADEICKRIDWIISNSLVRVAADSSGWKVLFQDLSDGRYWELSYPESELAGGGPPTLRFLPSDEAKLVYGIKG